jgi:hypothetical protein
LFFGYQKGCRGLTVKISSTEKYTCARCGRSFRLHQGVLTGFDVPQPEFHCLACLKQVDKEEREKRNPLSDSKIAAIRKEFEALRC